MRCRTNHWGQTRELTLNETNSVQFAKINLFWFHFRWTKFLSVGVVSKSRKANKVWRITFLCSFSIDEDLQARDFPIPMAYASGSGILQANQDYPDKIRSTEPETATIIIVSIFHPQCQRLKLLLYYSKISQNSFFVTLHIFQFRTPTPKTLPKTKKFA